MDSLQRSIYKDRFEAAFASKRGQEFQDWFAALASYAYGSDFEKVRPYGDKGDLKCDGRIISSGTIFQCYAPYSMKEADVIKKVTEDFNGALANWNGWMKQWLFVHNDERGLSADVGKHLDALRAKHPSVKIEVWEKSQLFNLLLMLDYNKCSAIFGPAASLALAEGIVMADLVPIIEALQRDELPDDLPLTAPSPEKLKRNDLSKQASEFLAVGQKRAGLVTQYFQKCPEPDLGERIAQAFRNRYAELKGLHLRADEIFDRLHRYAGKEGEPKQQAASLAVMAYFFESCDIFEDAEVVTS